MELRNVSAYKIEPTSEVLLKVGFLFLFFTYTALMTVFVGWFYHYDGDYIDEYFISTPIIFFPIFVCIGKTKVQKLLVVTIAISGYALGLLISAYFIEESNLWPFAIVLAPVNACPIVVVYFVIIDFIERCKSDPNLKW